MSKTCRKGLLSALGTAFILSSALTQAHAEDSVAFEIQKLGEGVYAAISPGPKMPAVANAAFIILSDSVMVVDSHMTRAAARALLHEIGQITDKPVRYLVQTHFHEDHVGGNPAFPNMVDIIAHTRARAHLKRSNPTGAVLPNATVEDGIIFHRGREVQIRFSGRGHTDGDLYVWLPEERILIAGDLVFNGYIGFLKDAYASEWAETLTKLIALNPQIVLPGHGEVADINALKIFRTYLWDFITEVKKKKDEGLSGGQTARSFKLPSSYASWGMQEQALKDNILRVYHELPEIN